MVAPPNTGDSSKEPCPSVTAGSSNIIYGRFSCVDTFNCSWITNMKTSVLSVPRTLSHKMKYGPGNKDILGQKLINF